MSWQPPAASGEYDNDNWTQFWSGNTQPVPTIAQGAWLPSNQDSYLAQSGVDPNSTEGQRLQQLESVYRNSEGLYQNPNSSFFDFLSQQSPDLVSLVRNPNTEAYDERMRMLAGQGRERYATIQDEMQEDRRGGIAARGALLIAGGALGGALASGGALAAGGAASSGAAGSGVIAAVPATAGAAGIAAGVPVGSALAAGTGLAGAAPAIGAAGGAAGAVGAAGGIGGAIMSNLPSIISGAASLLGGSMASNAAEDATNAQIAAGDRALGFQRESRDLALDIARPQLQSSQVALARMLSMTGQPIPAALQEALTAAGVTDIGEFNVEDDPSYQFRLSESMKALEAGAFARGGGMSGGFANQALRYAQDYASTEYSNIYARLATIGGYGPVAASSSSNAALNYGANASNTVLETGDARASGYVAQSNAWQNALDQISQLPWDQWLPQRQPQTAPARNGSWG